MPSKVTTGKGKWEGEDEDDDGPVVRAARPECSVRSPLIIAIITERLGGILRGRSKGQARVGGSSGAQEERDAQTEAR